MATEKRHRAALLCLATAAFVSATAPAWAQGEPSAEDKASARVLGTEGIRMADAHDCAGAIAKLAAAEKLYHAPTTLERLGECQLSLGKLVDGTETLNRVVREQLPPSPPPAFVAAKQKAQQLLTTALPRIGRLRIHVEGAPPEQAVVTVDDVKVPSALFDNDRPTDPGQHVLKASAPGFRETTATLTLADGQGQAVALKLEADPNAVATTTTTSLPPTAPSAAPPPQSAPATPAPAPAPGGEGGGSNVLAFGALGLGVAGVAVGTIFGVMALSTKSSLDSACTNKTCPSSSQSDIDALGMRATVSTVGFGVGIVGAGLGIVLLLTSHGKEAPPATATHVEPWVGLGSAGVGGTF